MACLLYVSSPENYVQWQKSFGYFKRTSPTSHDTIDLFLHLIFSHPVDSSEERKQSESEKSNPRKFDYAKPLKRWRKDWPGTYHQMLRILKEKWPGGRGIQEFVRILMLHEHYAASQIEQAIERALSYGCVHLDGVLYCLHEMASEAEPTDTKPLDLSDRPALDAFGNQPVDLSRYEDLLKLSW